MKNNIVLLLLIFCQPVFCQNFSEHKLDSIVQTVLKAYNISGLSIGIVKDEKVIYSKGFGFTNIDKQYSITDSTQFQIASIGKLFTTTAVMQLVEQGKLGISKKLIDYLPEVVMKDSRYKDITIYHLITHSSGLPWDVFSKALKYDSSDLQNYYLAFAKTKLKFNPGEKFSGETYSNAGMNLLGAVIDKISGMAYHEYIQKNIFEKLHMQSGTIFYKYYAKQNVAQPLELKDDKLIYCNTCPTGTYDQLPSGFFYASISDLEKFMLHYLKISNKKTTSGLLSTLTVKNIWGEHKTIPNKKTSIGIGWWRYNDTAINNNYVFHVGREEGYSSTLRIYPNENLGIVILSNAYYADKIIWNDLPDKLIEEIKKVEK